jgi:hypothetical protein
MNLADLKKAFIGGSLAGLLCAVFFIVVFSQNEVHPIARMLDFWIPGIFIGFFMWWIRETKPEPTFHFWQGLAIGNVIGAVCGLLCGISLFFIFKFVSDHALLNYLESVKHLLSLQNEQAAEPLSPEKLASVMKEVDDFNPMRFIWEEVFRKVSYCFVLVPLISMFFRRK